MTLTFALAGLAISADPLPSLTIELTSDRGFVLTLITEHSFSSQILEHCAIGGQIVIAVGKLSTIGTVAEINSAENYSKLVLINLEGIV